MCTMIAHQVKIQGRGKHGPEWFEVREANVSYDHPYDLPLEHALNIDFVNEALGPGARVAVELSVEAARQLVKTIEAVLAQADQRGVLEDLPVALERTDKGPSASLAPATARSTYREYASRAVIGRRLAAGAASQLDPSHRSSGVSPTGFLTRAR